MTPSTLFNSCNPAVSCGPSIGVKWAALVRDLVADINGTTHEPYLTFHDGWRYQAAIDAIRSGAGWRELL